MADDGYAGRSREGSLEHYPQALHDNLNWSGKMVNPEEWELRPLSTGGTPHRMGKNQDEDVTYKEKIQKILGEICPELQTAGKLVEEQGWTRNWTLTMSESKLTKLSLELAHLHLEECLSEFPILALDRENGGRIEVLSGLDKL